MATLDLSKLEAQLAIEEGRFASPYHDSMGILTVGIGHNLAAAPLPGQKYPMTDKQIDALFAKDIGSTFQKLDTYLPWWRTLSDPRQRVLADMCFNMGIGRPGSGHGLLSFGQFLNLVHVGNYAAAAKDMLNTYWAKQVHGRANRLAAMMRDG